MRAKDKTCAFVFQMRQSLWWRVYRWLDLRVITHWRIGTNVLRDGLLLRPRIPAKWIPPNADVGSYFKRRM